MNIFQYFSQLKFLEDPKYLFPVLVWIIIWKGLALWKSSQRKETLWFWLLMVINTLGILEICYIFVFSNPKTDFKFFRKMFKKIPNNQNKDNITVIEPIEEKQENQ